MSKEIKVLYVRSTTNEARVVVFPEESRVSVETLDQDSLGNESWKHVFSDPTKINILKKALWRLVVENGN